MEKTKKDHTGVFYVVNTPWIFKGCEPILRNGLQCDYPPLEINQFIPGQKCRVKISIQPQRQFPKKNYKCEGHFYR